MGMIWSYTKHSEWCTCFLHKHQSDSTQWSSNISHSFHYFCPLMASESLRQSHWLRLSGPVIYMSRRREKNGFISPSHFVDCVCLWVVCMCVSSSEATEWLLLCALLSWRARPPTPSSWPCADASQKPLHSLTPLSLSSHGLARQNPAIVSPRGVHRLANSRAHTHTHCASCTACTDGFRAMAKQYLNLQKKHTLHHLLTQYQDVFHKLNSFPVVSSPTVCPPTLISSQRKPSTSLNPKSLCVFMHACVCYCGSVCWLSKCISL